jgi:group I intron endonuclease
MTTIYAIECSKTGYVYVGCSKQTLNRRLNEHRSYLKRRMHTATKMTDDYDLYGPKSLTIRALEVLQSDELKVKREAELRWMHHFDKLGILYNAQLISFAPGVGYKLRSHTPEANEKRRLAQLGKPKREGQGAKISATKKALGQRPTLEAAKAGAIACHKVRYGT